MSAARMLEVVEAAKGFAAARAVLDGDTEDREAIAAACDVLGGSEWYQDVTRVRNARARLGREVLETRALAADEWRAAGIEPGLGRMAHHFEALDLRPAPRRGRVWVGGALLGFALAVLAHLAIAAPAKTARTVGLHHQIMEGR